MFFKDIGRAWEAIRWFKGGQNLDFYVKAVRPMWRGIVFETTYFTYITWNYNGEVKEYTAKEWRERE